MDDNRAIEHLTEIERAWALSEGYREDAPGTKLPLRWNMWLPGKPFGDVKGSDMIGKRELRKMLAKKMINL